MLTISRADVPSDSIITTPNDFIKVPIASYLESINIEPISSQIAFINAVNRYRFVVAALSRRQGKTYIANVIGQCVALKPGSNILIIAPNYSLSQISFELQRSLIKFHKLEVDKDNAKDRVIELANGSTIRIGSINQVDSCVGRSYDLIIFDEAALADGMDAFNVALRPTLDRPGSRALFISTPRGKTNWFSVLYQRGFSSEYPEWCSIKSTWDSNPRMTQADVEEAQRSMSAAEFAQEYMADFNQYEGQIWRLKPTAIKDKLSPGKCDMVAGLDLGFKDATALVVVGFEWQTGLYYILDEYQASGKTTSKHAAEIQRMIDKWDLDYIFIDHAAAQTRFDLARDYDIATINAKKSVLDGIGFVASLVDNDKVLVASHCTKVLEAFDAYRWDPNPNLIKEKPVHDGASHMADAIRYALYSFENRGEL